MPTKDENEKCFDDAHYRGWHLADTSHDALTTEFEWAMLRFQQAFERWVLQLGNITGMNDLSYTEIVILHVVGMQDRPKTAAAIARQLNRDDIPNIQYCIRKLIKHDLCQNVKQNAGKTRVYELTDNGRATVHDYAKLRQEILTTQTMGIDQVDDRMHDAARLISMLTGLYDEAGRISATYSRVRK